MPRYCLTFLALWLTTGCACSRSEEPASPSSESPVAGTKSAPTPTTPDADTTASAETTARPVCTVSFEPAPVASKAAQCPRDPTGNLVLPKGRVTFVDAPNMPSVEVELARDDAARSRGLMYRTSMAEGSGMLFSWEDEQPRSFWMRNTCIPLDLLYIDRDGIIAGILEQVPTLSDAPRGIKCPVSHVLELNAGWSRAHGLQPGMKVKIDG